MQWSDLESLGWRRIQFSEETQKYVYQTPIRMGLRKKISQKRDLDPSDLKFAHILFPKKKKKVKPAEVEVPGVTLVEGDSSYGGMKSSVEGTGGSGERTIKTQGSSAGVGKSLEKSDGGEGSGVRSNIWISVEVKNSLKSSDDGKVSSDGAVRSMAEGNPEACAADGNNIATGGTASGSRTAGGNGAGGGSEDTKESSEGMGSIEMEELGTIVPGLYHHKERLEEVAEKLQDFMREYSVTDFNIKKSVEDLEIALKTAEHPFSGLLVDYETNFFKDTLLFAMKHTPDLLYVLMRHSFTNQKLLDHTSVIKAATVYSQLAISINPTLYSAFNKWLSVVVQACGISATGLEILSSMGLSQNSRSLQNYKSELASKDEMNVLHLSSLYTALFVFDNLNKVSRKVSQDMVLPVLVWEKFFIPMSVDNSLSHEEKVIKFNVDFFNMAHISNQEGKEQFELVCHTVLGQLSKQIPGLEWISKVLPKSHSHPHKGTANIKSSIHLEPTINLSEMDHHSMTVILETLLMKRLHCLNERLDTKEMQEVYTAALFTIRRVGATEPQLREAEEVIDRVVQRYGKLILWGDQLTVKKALEAISSRKEDWNKFERMEYFAILMLGDLHITMAMVCKSMKALMPTMTSANPGTLGSFASLLMRSHRISNDEAKIKKSGNFEEHSNFLVTCGSTIVVEALERYKCQLDQEGKKLEETAAGAQQFFRQFLAAAKIQLWWDPRAQEYDYYDDAEEYAVSASIRTILLMSYKHAIKFGDAMSIHVIHKILAIFFQFSSAVMNSQYGPSLLNECIDYEGLSSMDKMRVDTMITVNYTGEEGKNIAMDCMNEHKVGSCKCLMDRFTTSFDLNVVDRAMKANNQILDLKDHMLDCLCREDLKSGGGSSVKYFRDEEKELVKKEVRDISPLLDPSGRNKVMYSFKVRGPWKNLTFEKVKKVIDHKSELYDLERGTNM